MKRDRLPATTILTLLLLGASGLGTPAAADSLPADRSELLLVGDSVTAGIYFLSLSETTIRQGWAGQLMLRLGLPLDRCAFDDPFPLNHLGLTRLGFSVAGLAYPWGAIPALLPQKPRYAADEERVILAVPGQMAHELLSQSSTNRGHGSSGWTFANLLLPQGLSAIETIEQWSKRPRWVVLFIGANDLLASFSIVGSATSPSAEDFALSYEELVSRLRAVMATDAGPDHLLLLTLPDVSGLPFLQSLPPEARDVEGRPFQAGSKASAFLIPFRDRFQRDEVWSAAQLLAIRERAEAYNRVIRRIGRQREATVVEIPELFEELRQDPEFDGPNSPYFSPDLHHPSFRTHRRIADLVSRAMARVAGVAPPPPRASMESPLPHNGDFSAHERARVDAMMHLGLLGLARGPLPPRPTFRIEAQGSLQSARRREGSAALSMMIGIESTPSPVSSRWLSRGSVHLRASPLVLDASGGGDGASFPEESLEIRAGVALEPIGGWHWTRFGAGALWSVRHAFGWYGRSEWRLLYAELSGRGAEPDRVELGLRWGWLFGRVGRNGN